MKCEGYVQIPIRSLMHDPVYATAIEIIDKLIKAKFKEQHSKIYMILTLYVNKSFGIETLEVQMVIVKLNQFYNYFL